MKRTNILQRLNRALSPDKVDFSSLDSEIAALKKKLEEKVYIETIDDVGRKLKQFQKSIDLEPLMAEIEKIRGLFNESAKHLEAKIIERQRELSVAGESKNLSRITLLNTEIDVLKNNVATREDLDLLNQQLSEVKGLEGRINNTIKQISTDLASRSTKDEFKKSLDELQETIDSLRRDMLRRLQDIGGGAAHRQINVNSSVMSVRYTDINFQSNTAITWVATNDDTFKRVNIAASLISGGAGGGSLTVKEVDGTPNVSPVTTIVVSNGTLTDDGGGQVTVTTGGGGGGLTRTSSVISVSSTMAAAASTDYVFFPNVGVTLTLPTAINNSNLYTVKNFSASSILVAAATGQDIDGSTTALLPTQNESLSFISNGSVWGVV